MKRTGFGFWVLTLCLCLLGCGHLSKDKVILQRSFYNTLWERFDYVNNDIEIMASTTYDLSMKISFNLKDEEGHWNIEKKDDCYTFTLPINKQLTISDPGKYQFRIEQKQPITPLVGVKELVLMNDN